MELHERIALARKQAGLSQEQLGEKLGVSRQAVSKWESGQSNPDVAYVAGMCRLFGVSSDWLLLGEESDQTNAPARCPGCQTIVTGLDNFCPNCGKNLGRAVSDTYTLLLNPDWPASNVQSDLCRLSGLGIFPSDSPLGSRIQYEQADKLYKSAPCVLATGLTQQSVSRILSEINDEGSFAFYRDSDGSTPEELLEKAPVPSYPFKPPKEPLSFGMVVLAVVVAILIISFL